MMNFAFQGTEFEALAPYLEGPTAIAISKEDATAPARILSKFAKTAPALELKAAVVEGNLYSVDGTILYRYAPAKDATSFTVPEGVTTIGDYAFANATNLTEVIIPSEVVTVGNEMFFGTTNVVVKVEASEVSANYPNDWAKYAKDVVYDYLTGDDDDNIVEF